MIAGSSTSLASVTFEDEEREAEVHHRKRQRKLNEIKEALTTRYQEFEEALHRRMLIRDMKVSLAYLTRTADNYYHKRIVPVVERRCPHSLCLYCNSITGAIGQVQEYQSLAETEPGSLL